MKTQWYQLSAADALKQLSSDSAAGLSSAEAQTRLATVGPNELVERGGRTRWEIIVEQLTGVLTILLFVAALVSAMLGDWLEAVVILAIVVLNAVLGYVQEYKAEQSMAALKRMSVPHVRVRRDGKSRRSRRASWCPATWCSWRPATSCRPTAASSRASTCASRRRR